MAPKSKDKTTVCIVMTFGPKNAPPTFQSWVFEVFKPYLTTFLRVFLDDLNLFGKLVCHLKHLNLCFEGCKILGLSLNPYRYAFTINNGCQLMPKKFKKFRIRFHRSHQTYIAKRIGNKDILVATNYCTKWVIVIALRDNKESSVAKFL